MIYICEYDGTTEKQELLEAAAYLPEGTGLDFRGDIAAALGDDRKKASASRREKCREHIFAWLLLAYAVRNERGYSLQELQISRAEKGKPYSSAYPELSFNLSHCSTACACIVDTKECGIDIERKFAYRESLAKKICHREEWEIFREISSGIRREKSEAAEAVFGSWDADGADYSDWKTEQLRILWSIKEAYVKKDGRGLGYGMDRVNFAGLLPFADTGICPERSILWYSQKSYTLAACAGQKILAEAGPEQKVSSLICRVSEEELIH